MKKLVGAMQVHEMNPYVIQATRLSESLSYLSGVFNKKIVYEKNYDSEDVERILSMLNEEGVCKEGVENPGVQDLIIQIMDDIEAYGDELSVENRRGLAKEYSCFDEVYELVKKEFTNIKGRRLEEGQAFEERDACLSTISLYAGATAEATRSLEKSIFEDKRVQKKITNTLRKNGVKVLRSTVMVSDTGVYEVIVTGKARKDVCISTKQVGEILGQLVGRVLKPDSNERMVLNKEYTTLHFREQEKYQVLHGVAQRTKEGSEKSGDNFLVMNIPGGKKVIIISDGMGSGLSAYKMSEKILDGMEVLLQSGMSLKNTISICNSMLVSSQKGMDFGTLDVCILDSCSGMMEIGKAGGAYTFIIGKEENITVEPSSLPMGVMNGVEIDLFSEPLEDGAFVVMMTDGVTELIREDNKVAYISNIIEERPSKNPKELAECIMESVLEANGNVATDDMMVVVIGCWRREVY